MEFLDMILGFLNSAMAQYAVIAMVVEFILRLIPSEKPLSIAHLVGDFAKKIGNVLLMFGDLLDKILPQKLK